jgi:hypothetical protein
MKGVMMSVRATERLISDIVVVTGLSNSPRMVVQTVDIENKMVSTVWFSDTHEMQAGLFPAGALDRAEDKAKAPKAAAKGKGRK